MRAAEPRRGLVSPPAADLLHAWKQLLFNQFHDILPGPAIATAFADATAQHGEVQSIAARVANRSVQNIARLVDVPMQDGTQPILVFNPHPWTLVTTVEAEGRQHFSYRLVPHAGNWRESAIPRRTAELLMPPFVMFESFHAGSLPGHVGHLSIDDVHVQITAVKAAEDDPRQVVVRAVETSGSPRRAVIDLPLLHRSVTAEFGAHEIKTFLVSADPDVPVVEVDLIERIAPEVPTE